MQVAHTNFGEAFKEVYEPDWSCRAKLLEHFEVRLLLLIIVLLIIELKCQFHFLKIFYFNKFSTFFNVSLKKSWMIVNNNQDLLSYFSSVLRLKKSIYIEGIRQKLVQA